MSLDRSSLHSSLAPLAAWPGKIEAMPQIQIVRSLYARDFTNRVNDMLADGWKVNKLTAVAVGGGGGGTQNAAPSADDLYAEYIAFMVWTDDETEPPPSAEG